MHALIRAIIVLRILAKSGSMNATTLLVVTVTSTFAPMSSTKPSCESAMTILAEVETVYLDVWSRANDAEVLESADRILRRAQIDAESACLEPKSPVLEPSLQSDLNQKR